MYSTMKTACAPWRKPFPAWQPPEHGYHPHTYGVMLDELMIRLTGSVFGHIG